ncbi:peptide deformylase [[Clostridium] cellulosi]|jgi:peptide deformylase|uniref:Peptide deformylase n=1 Tax=[Clostridium] cellulosi TaxID=29343 RepID=A0A078KPS0_9FIRM|nr:peptide deformylase [[Clostridium] cellulosi]
MAIRNVVKLGDDILRKKSKPVTEFNEKLNQLLDDMKETLKSQDGVGLAAPQVGVLKRAIVVSDEGNMIELINPVVVKASGVQENVEGCLSIPGKYGITKRPRKVTVKAQDRNGNEIMVTGTDLLARCLCHEIDHLNGILFIDNVIRMLEPEELQPKNKNKK